ncbi:MAG: hypothetical protein U5N86_11435 [Planctomycetota bacterium]|nr:hypothetical protein [Planctomycetota bacterium]
MITVLWSSHESSAYSRPPGTLYNLSRYHQLAGYFSNKLNCPDRARDILGEFDRGIVSSEVLILYAKCGTTFTGTDCRRENIDIDTALDIVRYIIKNEPYPEKGLPANLKDSRIALVPGTENLFMQFDNLKELYQSLSSQESNKVSSDDILKIFELQCHFNTVKAKLEPDLVVHTGDLNQIAVEFLSKGTTFAFNPLLTQKKYVGKVSVPQWFFSGFDDKGNEVGPSSKSVVDFSIDARHVYIPGAFTSKDHFVLELNPPYGFGAEFVPPHVYTGKFVFFDDKRTEKSDILPAIFGAFRAESNEVTIRAVLPKTKRASQKTVIELLNTITDLENHKEESFIPGEWAKESESYGKLCDIGLSAIPAIVEIMPSLGVKKQVLSLFALTEITGLRRRSLQQYEPVQFFNTTPNGVIEYIKPSQGYVKTSLRSSIKWWQNFVMENAASWEQKQ